MNNLINFLKRILGLGAPTLADVAASLKNADKAKQEHIDHLLDASDAIQEHNAAQRQTIAGLAAGIGQAQAAIDAANYHHEDVQAALAAASK